MTRDEMEARRLEARKLIVGGERPSKVAKKCGVSRTTVSRWVAALNLGSDLRKRKATGRPPRVSLGFVRSVYRKGMRYAAMKNMIELKLGVSITEEHAGRLIHKAGLVPSRPRKK